MNFKKTLSSALAIALTVAFAHCGSDGSDTNTLGFGNTGNLSGLYAVSSTPANGESYVSRSTNTIQIRMSQPIASTSIPNNVQFFKTLNGQESNITSSFTITVNNELITLQGSGQLDDNTNYEIRLFPGLASTSGNTLLQGQQFQYFYIDFYTGNGQTLGQSHAGAPGISSITRSNGFSCFGANIAFDESLAYQPIIQIRVKNGIAQMMTVPSVYPYPTQSNTNTIWHVDLDPSYCQDLWSLGNNVYVSVQDYVDIEGNHGTPSSEKGFYVF